MKTNLISIAKALLTIIVALYKIGRMLYFKFSRHVLKRYFGIETRIYRKWHDRRVKKLQLALDAEHNN